MLRPQLRSLASQGRLTPRSPQVRPTDDDHPLLLDISAPDHDFDESRSRYGGRASSQLGGLHGIGPVESSIDSRPGAQTHGRCAMAVRSGGPFREVYIHRVTRSDTLPKIILGYRIPADILRRANRMYANDSIQFRDVLLLPVDACDLKPSEVPQASSISIIPSSSRTTTTSSAVSLMNECPFSTSVSSRTSTTELTSSGHSRPTIERRLSPSKARKSDAQDRGEEMKAIRQVLIPGVGQVDVSLVPASSLSYFPPPKVSKATPGTDKVQELGAAHVGPVDRHLLAVPENHDLQERNERSSFETIRISAGKVAADAYNGTQGLIRRMKDKKHQNEIDLIEL